MNMDDREAHPSYGQMVISRFTSSHRIPLYGTSNECREGISLSIRRSELMRTLHRSWHSAKEEIIEVVMSPSQFAEAITNLNRGEGTPVTISRLDMKRIDPPPHKDERDMFDEEFKDNVRKISDSATEMIDQAQKALSEKSITKASLKGVLDILYKIKQDLNENIPYIGKCFNEHLNNSISSAKIEFDAFVDSQIRNAGMAALSKDAVTPGMLTDESGAE